MLVVFRLGNMTILTQPANAKQSGQQKPAVVTGQPKQQKRPSQPKPPVQNGTVKQNGVPMNPKQGTGNNQKQPAQTETVGNQKQQKLPVRHEKVKQVLQEKYVCFLRLLSFYK